MILAWCTSLESNLGIEAVENAVKIGFKLSPFFRAIFIDLVFDLMV